MQNLPADQNPAVIVIQPPPSPPPQGRNTPASLPSLESLPAEEESDPDIEIIGYVGPRRNRVNFPREDNDSSPAGCWSSKFTVVISEMLYFLKINKRTFPKECPRTMKKEKWTKFSVQ